MNAVHFSSERMDWNTPNEVLDLVRAFAGKEGIGLDPCSGESSIVGARTNWVRHGLALDWIGHGLVFVNPPYSRAIVQWAGRAVAQAELGAEVIMLLPARTDARWWQQHVVRASVICFWRGRLRFLGAPASAPFPSALVYFGARHRRFGEVFGAAGWTVRP